MPGEMQHWNIDEGTRVSTPMVSDRWRDVAAFSSEGKWFATASDPNTVQIWSLPSGQPFGDSIECESAPKTLVFSNDGKLILVGTEKGEVRVWDIEAGNQRGITLSLGATISAAAFFPNDDRFLVGDWDQKASIHNVDRELGENYIELPHDGIVLNVGINPAETQYFTSDSDGGMILASYLDGSTLIWDIQTFDEIGPPLWHAKEGTALAQSKDGVWAATASRDKTARLWEIGAAKGTLESVRRRYETLNGMRQLPDGSLEIFSADQWIDLKKVVGD